MSYMLLFNLSGEDVNKLHFTPGHQQHSVAGLSLDHQLANSNTDTSLVMIA